MRICILGDFNDSNLNEGVKNVTNLISRELAYEHEILELNIMKAYTPQPWKQVGAFRPHVIHCFSCATLKSFFLLRYASFRSRNKSAKTVMSAAHPYFLGLLDNPIARRMISSVKPHLILTQSPRVVEKLNELRFNCALLPNGVNVERFAPVSDGVKRTLRAKYRINEDSYVVLHVGHISPRRNLQVLSEVQGDDTQVIVVASTHHGLDSNIRNELVTSGCKIWQTYCDHIEEVYVLSNCYVFPAISGKMIFSPLSVLEAMSCNLPVITTRHEWLTSMLKEGQGLKFAESNREILEGISDIKADGGKINTREQVLPYSWKKVVQQLEAFYEKLLTT
jgi:glycosyltransferase involved in cell wall biosynthesis